MDMMKYFKFVKTRWFLAICCVLLGALVVLGIRFATYHPDDVHYHANFALYINGKREEFKSGQYYTEIEMCKQKNVIVPQERAHMHENINNVIHIEDHAVTWGQFFTTVHYYLGPTSIAAPDDNVYSLSGDSKLHLILNGQDYTDLGGLQNTVINDKDKLLVSYGNYSDMELSAQYKAIPSTAAKYDMAKDPKSCGSHSKTSLHDRFVHIF